MHLTSNSVVAGLLWQGRRALSREPAYILHVCCAFVSAYALRLDVTYYFRDGFTQGDTPPHASARPLPTFA